jgi:hypothetical protein
MPKSPHPFCFFLGFGLLNRICKMTIPTHPQIFGFMLDFSKVRHCTLPVLHCTLLHCTLLHCTLVLVHSTLVHCTLVHCTLVHCTWYSSTLYSSTRYVTPIILMVFFRPQNKIRKQQPTTCCCDRCGR